MAFPARHIHVITSATVRGRDPVSLARTAALLGLGRCRPCSARPSGRQPWSASAAIPTVPPVLAAALRGIPDADPRAERGDGPRQPAAGAARQRDRHRLCRRARSRAAARRQGDPHRQSGAAGGDRGGDDALCRAATRRSAASPRIRRQPGRAHHGRHRAGGDRAARSHLRSRLKVVQQAREEDVGAGQATSMRGSRVAAEVAPFFTDLPARIAASHLVVSRSGASTVAELAAIGRPAILVPLPHALDQDQPANAGVLEAAGAAIRLRQDEFTPERLAAEIAALASDAGEDSSPWPRPPARGRDRRRRPAGRSGA